VVKRSASGRAIEIRVTTDAAEIVLRRFDLRQAWSFPRCFSRSEGARGAGEPEFLFLGRGWGHGVGLCQSGAYGMALAGSSYDQILRHYYTGIEIASSDTVTAAPRPPVTCFSPLLE
jgi:stage II sporulation protein D